MAKMRVLAQAPTIQVDWSDLVSGFVDAECATRIELRSNARCRIAFRPSADWFDIAHVYGFPRVIEIGPAGGAFVRPLECRRLSLYQLSFRFELRTDTLPGTYRWPLAVSLEGEWEQPTRRRGLARIALSGHLTG